MKGKWIVITAEKDGLPIRRECYGDFQAFTIINQLHNDGCKNIGMREEWKNEGND